MIHPARSIVPDLHRRRKKPEGRVAINRAHPLAKKLVAYSHLKKSQFEDIVTGRPFFTDATEWHYEHPRLASVDSFIRYASPGKSPTALGDHDFTIMLSGNFGTGAGGAGIIQRRSIAASGHNGFWQVYASGTIRYSVYAGGSHSLYNFTSINYAVGIRTYLLVYNAADSTATLYRTGPVAYASQTLTGVVAPTGEDTHELVIGRAFSDSGGDGIILTPYEFGIWHRQLSPSEASAIGAQPLYSQILVPDIEIEKVGVPGLGPAPPTDILPIVLSNQETICR